MMLTFGPIPSRRLGRSLGINNIPPKTCTYACVYCQVGRTTHMEMARRRFRACAEIVQAVERKVEQAKTSNALIDYLSFVPDGEPTLDVNLEQEIRELRGLGHKVAVISNASLIWQTDVRSALNQADWVSLKVDAAEESTWRKIDRPHGKLSLNAILEGTREFAQSYAGELVSETMLVRGVNDDERSLSTVAAFLAEVRPAIAYISVPTRPPAESWVQAPTEDVLHLAYQIFSTYVDNVEYLISYEGSDFSVTGGVEEDLLSITAVHPMREDAVLAFVKQGGAEESVIKKLTTNGALARVSYKGKWFYVRRFSR